MKMNDKQKIILTFLIVLILFLISIPVSVYYTMELLKFAYTHLTLRYYP